MMVKYVLYNGRQIPFGNYVIWDDKNNVFLAFDNIEALRSAMDRMGYTRGHKAVKDGYYTEYGYFSDSKMLDLYYKYRFPDVETEKGRKIVWQKREEYFKNPEKVREEIRNEILNQIKSYEVSKVEENNQSAQITAPEKTEVSKNRIIKVAKYIPHTTIIAIIIGTIALFLMFLGFK